MLTRRAFGLSCFGVGEALAGPQRLIWRDPGDVAKLDFAGSLGEPVTPPEAPFTFLEEDMSGTQPKFLFADARKTRWNVKFGNEVKPECFTWRLPRAVGYFVAPNFYVADGEVSGLRSLRRQTEFLSADGKFREARFQWRNPQWQYLKKQNWSWRQNPFLGTPQFSGLKIFVMLASNWDNKDGSDRWGPNTGIFSTVENGQKKLLYSFTDWGSGMGHWGDREGQSNWRCDHYGEQSAEFVRGVEQGRVTFGYEGHHKADFQGNIQAAHVGWLMQYLGQVSDAQLRAGLRASGANETEEECFARALRQRIDALKAVAQQSATDR